jgi:hypothetical protein
LIFYQNIVFCLLIVDYFYFFIVLSTMVFFNWNVHMSEKLKPGQKAPRSGEYEIHGRRGGDTGQERTAIKGKPLPPTPSPGQTYVMHRPAHNGAGKKSK